MTTIILMMQHSDSVETGPSPSEDETKSRSDCKPALRKLYPTLTDEELKEAEENLRRYAMVALEIHRECERGDRSV